MASGVTGAVQDSRTLFRKSVAMLDEPDASYGYFRDLLSKMLANVQDTPKAQLGLLRRINICLMVLFVWAREAKDLEAPYRASELAILRAWPMIVPHLAGKGKVAASLVRAVDNLIQQHFEVRPPMWTRSTPTLRNCTRCRRLSAPVTLSISICGCSKPWGAWPCMGLGWWSSAFVGWRPIRSSM